MSRRRTLLSHARKPVRWLNLLPYVSILVIVNDSMPMYSSQVLRNHSNFYKHHKEVVSCHTLLDPILYQIWHPDKRPFKVSSMFALTLLRRQQLALVKLQQLYFIRSAAQLVSLHDYLYLWMFID